MKDKLATYSVEQLKSAYMAEVIINENPAPAYYSSSFSFGEPDVDLKTEQKTMRYGQYSWTQTRCYLNYILPEDWYDRVYLSGVGKVTYHSKTTLVMDAKELPDYELRSDLMLPGFKVFKVKLPVWGRRGYIDTVETVERYMVMCEINDGEESLAFAGKHANAAAANLKKKMLLQMESMMGI